MPRYLAATRPGTRSTVLEIDGGVVALGRQRARRRRASPGLTIRVGDARTGLQRAAARHRFDLVVGDAFGGLAVPWHLTTREVAEQVRDVLTGDGVYAVNVIDYQPDRFARAEIGDPAVGLRARDAARRAGHAWPARAAATTSSSRPGSRCRWPTSSAGWPSAGPGWSPTRRRPRAFAGPRRVLTDAHAPVDQLITQFSR